MFLLKFVFMAPPINKFKQKLKVLTSGKLFYIMLVSLTANDNT